MDQEQEQEQDQEMEMEQEREMGLEEKQQEQEERALERERELDQEQADEEQEMDFERERLQEQEREQEQEQTEEDVERSAEPSRSGTPLSAVTGAKLRPPPAPAPSSPLSSAPASINGDTTPSMPLTPLPAAGGRKKRRLTQVLSSSPLGQSPVKLAITAPDSDRDESTQSPKEQREDGGPSKRRRVQETPEELGTMFEASPMPSERMLEDRPLASPGKRLAGLSPAPPARALSPVFGLATPPLAVQELEKDVLMEDAAASTASQEPVVPSPTVADQPPATLSVTIPITEPPRDPTPPPAKEPTPPPAPPPVRKWTLKEWAAARKRGEVGKTLKTPAEELGEPLLSAGPSQDSPMLPKATLESQTPAAVEKPQERPTHVDLSGVGVEAALAPFHSPLIETKHALPLVSPKAGVLMPGTPSPPKETRLAPVEQPSQPVVLEKPESLKVEKSALGVRFQEPAVVVEQALARLQDALQPVASSAKPEPAVIVSTLHEAQKAAEPAMAEESKAMAEEPQETVEVTMTDAQSSPSPAQQPAAPVEAPHASRVMDVVKAIAEAASMIAEPTKAPTAPALEVKTGMSFTSLADAMKPFVALRSPPRPEVSIPVSTFASLAEPASAKSPAATSHHPLSEKGKSPSPMQGGVEEGEVGEGSGERLDEPRYDDDREYRRSRSPDRRRTPPYGESGYDSRRYPQSPPRRPMYDDGRPRSPSYSGPPRSPPYNAPRSPRYGQRSPRWQARDRSPPRAPRSYPPPVSPVFHAHPGPGAPPFRGPPPGPSRGYPPLAPRAEQGYREGYEPGRGPPLGPRALYGQSPYGPPRAPYPPLFAGRGGGPPPVAPRGSFPPRGGWRGRGRGGNWR
ncbi:hypothetical protein CALCODRAFT_489221 [Calocera cornea HHB12733]|uniref:Uncharacterized protein n=1 Tax=Calocera cornea HHB12733 TaxID=1353952 RepID=A0A165K6C1_9BASI|nr:hypothetical protein CALCODRAFT_489221 [Calocera cornea HHB12733]